MKNNNIKYQNSSRIKQKAMKINMKHMYYQALIKTAQPCLNKSPTESKAEIDHQTLRILAG